MLKCLSEWFINEEVYVHQPVGFVDKKKPNHVFKLTKAMYGLKQAPRVWHDRLSAFLINNNFIRGKWTPHSLSILTKMICL